MENFDELSFDQLQNENNMKEEVRIFLTPL